MMGRASTDPQSKPAVETIAREEAVKLMRAELLELDDQDNSICKSAAQKGIFCKGFQRFSDFELRRRYRWIARKDRSYTRAEVEDLANRWQLARQDVDELPLACDVQQVEHDSCRGWDDFSNEELAKFLFQTTGRALNVE